MEGNKIQEGRKEVIKERHNKGRKIKTETTKGVKKGK